jgi:hypothetical protein
LQGLLVLVGDLIIDAAFEFLVRFRGFDGEDVAAAFDFETVAVEVEGGVDEIEFGEWYVLLSLLTWLSFTY